METKTNITPAAKTAGVKKADEQGAQPGETPAQGTNGTAEGANGGDEQGANDLEVNDHEILLQPHVYGDKTYTLRENVKQLQFNGKVYSRADLLTNEEIMEKLITSNSPFIKKV